MLEYWKKALTGGTRSVASGHDEAWPSRTAIRISPSLQYSSEILDKEQL
jgi:hypothetical protein